MGAGRVYMGKVTEFGMESRCRFLWREKAGFGKSHMILDKEIINLLLQKQNDSAMIKNNL